MCLAVPARIEEIYVKDGLKMARVDFGGVSREVCLDYVPEAQVGEYCIIHVGFAISLLSEAEAQETLALLNEIAEVEENAELDSAAPASPPTAR
jgi:hydrogenase expression/formation protein HypC